MLTTTKQSFTQINKSNVDVRYEGKPVTIITVFSDIDVAMVEDEDGNIMDVKHSELQKIDN